MLRREGIAHRSGTSAVKLAWQNAVICEAIVEHADAATRNAVMRVNKETFAHTAKRVWRSPGLLSDVQERLQSVKNSVSSST